MPPCIIDITDTGGTDGGVVVPPDTGIRVDGGGGGTCGSVGTIGGHCRGGASGACGMGECGAPLMAMAGGYLTVRDGYGIDQGTAPDPTTGFSTPAATQDPDLDIPLIARSGSMCTLACDTAAMTDTCGTCSSCNGTIGIGLLAPYLFYAEGTAPFDQDTGWCRANCDFDPAAAGATCPTATTATSEDAYTCSPLSNTCIEGCVSDNECRFEFVQQRNGFFLSYIDPARTEVCSPTTHRCEWTNTDTETVGDTCEANSDCAEDVGLCLRGGTCAELECATAADTAADMTCDGGAGVCLGNGGNNASICVQGCGTSADCNAGSSCIPFTGGMTVGGFSGYCLGICDDRADDPDGLTGPMTSADDELFFCDTGRGERCDNPLPSADDLDPTGTCALPCSVDADCTGDEGNYCDIVEGSSPAYGFCRWTDQVCGPDNLNGDCYADQVCDLLAVDGNAGLCSPACDADADCTRPRLCIGGTRACVGGTAAGTACTTDAMCAGGGTCSVRTCTADADCTGGGVCGAAETCVLTPAAGPRGVCRRSCSTAPGSTACPTGTVCQGNATDGFYCEQMPPA